MLRVELEGGRHVVKWRWYRWYESLAHLFVPHALRRAWRAAHGFHVRGLPTPQAAALVERRWLGMVRSAFLIQEEVVDAQPLDRYLWGEFGPNGRRPPADAASVRDTARL